MVQRSTSILFHISLCFMLGLSIAEGCAPAANAANTDDTFYKGKQIDLIVGSPPGGAYDIYARILTKFMGNYVAGNPTFVVKNMPGAGGLSAANYMYNSAPRDGTVIASPTQNIPTAPILSPTGVRYDANKLSWIGSISKDVFVAYVWSTSPIRSLNDLKTNEGTFGGNAVGNAAIDFAIIARDFFGFKMKIIAGYAGGPDVKLAMERGEIDGVFGNGFNAVNAQIRRGCHRARSVS